MSPEEETKQRIIQGAAQTFAQKGYDGATTRAIAEAAGVNEVTLFRHFGNKKNLFLAVVEQFSALPGLKAALEKQLTGDYCQDLLTLGTQFLSVMLKRRKAILMSLCAAERLPEIRDVVTQPPTKQREVLAGYIRQQIERGVVQTSIEPELAAQAFFGMLFEFAISRGLYPDTDPEKVIAQYVDVFVHGTIKRE